MQWIWTDLKTGEVNTYAEFMQVFSYSGGKAELKLSASDEYAVFVGGSFVDCGQYLFYPHIKFYDKIDVKKYLKNGDVIL